MCQLCWSIFPISWNCPANNLTQEKLQCSQSWFLGCVLQGPTARTTFCFHRNILALVLFCPHQVFPFSDSSTLCNAYPQWHGESSISGLYTPWSAAFVNEVLALVLVQGLILSNTLMVNQKQIPLRKKPRVLNTWIRSGKHRKKQLLINIQNFLSKCCSWWEINGKEIIFKDFVHFSMKYALFLSHSRPICLSRRFSQQQAASWTKLWEIKSRTRKWGQRRTKWH